MSGTEKLRRELFSSLRERPTRERQEARFERLYRRLHERHERVRHIYLLEEKLRRQPFHRSYHDAFIELRDELERLDSGSIEHVIDATDQFLLAREAGKEYYTELEETVLEEFEGFAPMTTPELIGHAFFERVTGDIPVGTVAFEYREGCFQLYLERERDYMRFEEAALQVKLDQKDDAPCGRFIGDFHTTNDRGEDFVFPLILINGNQDKHETELTRDHEEQHLAHHVSFLLKSLDQLSHPAPIYDQLSLYEQDIKDELLAFTREGAMGKKFIYDFFPSYLETFKLKDPKNTPSPPLTPREFSLRERSLIKREIRHIARRISTSFLAKLGTRGRAFLVTHLYDIPLRQIPDWLDLLDEYYQEREGMIQDYFVDVRSYHLIPEERSAAKRLETAFRRRRYPYQDALLGVTEDGRAYDWRKEFPTLIYQKKMA